MRSAAHVVRACRLGMFVQAMVINLTPLFFVQLHGQFGLTWEQLGRLVLLNFLTQLLVDLAGGWLVARFGLRPLCVLAHAAAVVGLLVYAVAPLAGGYATLVVGTIIFSAGCGLLEVLLSPILDAVPSTRKAGDMALLHAFYPLGKLAVIIGTGLALWLSGPAAWPWVVAAWAVLPAIGMGLFATVDLPTLPSPAPGWRIGSMVRTPEFRRVLMAMALAGASEVAIAQWTSAFAQRGLGCTPAVADLVGFGLFAVGMAVGRLWYGLRGGGQGLANWLIAGGAASAVVYLVAALSPWPVLALAACASAGFAVSMLWPMTLSLSAARWPSGGAVLFATLAAAGDGGAALGPWLVGITADAASSAAAWWQWLPGVPASADVTGLRVGLLAGAIAPFLLVLVAWRLRRSG